MGSTHTSGAFPLRDASENKRETERERGGGRSPGFVEKKFKCAVISHSKQTASPLKTAVD